MITDILLLLIGLCLIVFGADWLVDGASSVARRFGLSEFVIGLTIVGFGTSCPELVVSLTGAIAGNGAISMGNVMGSNIFNTLLILGLTALLTPIAVSDSNRKVDIPITLAVTLLFIGTALTGNRIARWEAIGYLVFFAVYIYYCFKSGNGSEAEVQGQADGPVPPIGKALVLIIFGLCGLIFGGDLFVDHSVELAHKIGISDKVIAITLLAGGTSFPELATCIVAAAKHKPALALGNILGSNIFNILLIIGCSALVNPISCQSMNPMDYVAIGLSALLVLLCTLMGRKDKLDRWEGGLMIAVFVAYYIWLFIKQ